MVIFSGSSKMESPKCRHMWSAIWLIAIFLQLKCYFPRKSFPALCDNISSVQSLSHVWLFMTPRTAALQASLFVAISQSLLKLMSIKSVTPSNHLILCCPLLLLPSKYPSIRVFPNELALPIRWPKYWDFSYSISPSNEYSGLISFRMSWLVGSLQFEGLSRVFSNTTIQKHQFFGVQLSL